MGYPDLGAAGAAGVLTDREDDRAVAVATGTAGNGEPGLVAGGRPVQIRGDGYGHAGLCARSGIEGGRQRKGGADGAGNPKEVTCTIKIVGGDVRGSQSIGSVVGEGLVDGDGSDGRKLNYEKKSPKENNSKNPWEPEIHVHSLEIAINPKLFSVMFKRDALISGSHGHRCERQQINFLRSL